jgi:hypothetical protein
MGVQICVEEVPLAAILLEFCGMPLHFFLDPDDV